MGMFIKFECSNCGEYECSCPMELRNPPRPEPEPQTIKPFVPATSSKKELPFVTTDEYIQGEFNGIDGIHVYIPLTEPFEKGDVITNGFQNKFTFHVEDEPVFIEKPCGDSGVEQYWLHKTILITKNKTDYCPRKYLLPGTQFVKIQDATLNTL